MMIERVWFETRRKKSPKDLRYNCILWLATYKQHTHTHTQTRIQANIGNQIEEEEE